MISVQYHVLAQIKECYLFSEMSELLFECYHVPKVAYGVDALFSLLNNHPNPGKEQDT